jgi:hypothetical protein
MTARLVAALVVLLSTFGFVFVLLLEGYDLTTSLCGAGAAGVVAAKITHGLLGGSGGSDPPGGSDPADRAVWKIRESSRKPSRLHKPSGFVPEPDRPELG